MAVKVLAYILLKYVFSNYISFLQPQLSDMI